MKRITILLLLLLFVVACGQDEAETAVTPIPPTPTSEPTPIPLDTNQRDYIIIATDAPAPNFAEFDKFGNVIGFNDDLMAHIAAVGNFDYEFVVTPFDGLLDLVAAYEDFDAVMANLVIPDVPTEGIAFTNPYLEVGQVLVVLADEDEILSYQDLPAGTAVGVIVNSSGEETAREVVGLTSDNIYAYDSPAKALQALIEETVTAVVIDSYAAEHYAQTYPEQLKIVGGEGQEAWISSKAYGIAVPANSVGLLDQLNEAIALAQEDQTLNRLTVAWLLPDEAIDPGESRVGTSASELVIGMLGDLADMDPAMPPDLISWEVKNNTMSGLYMFDSNNQLVPILASGDPIISEDKLTYEIGLRRNLRFPDGTDFTAEDVKWSLDRARWGRGGYLVNRYLKDSNEDNYADEDAVQVVDPYTIRIVLQEPTAYLPTLLATPPFFPVSNECYAETEDLLSSCGGIGPYTIVSWDVGDRMRLKANPEWPGRPSPAFENIQLRFYNDADDLRRSLVEFNSVDVAWTGLPYQDYTALANNDVNGDGTVDFTGWTGPATFKSYLIFTQQSPPWDNALVRQAAAYALDREAIAQNIFAGSRSPLYTPVPTDIPGSTAVFPTRDLAQAQALLGQVGYSVDVPLPITLWYLSDGRYSSVEGQYAEAIKSQLEETGIFQVTLQSADWEAYRVQIAQCNYPAYLLGWPAPGQPVNYLDMTSWTDFFIQNSDSDEECDNYPNYQSTEMADLVKSAREELDVTARNEIYAQIQQLWATDLPTLDLVQESRYAISLPNVENIRIDGMGFLHYEDLTKGG